MSRASHFLDCCMSLQYKSWHQTCQCQAFISQLIELIQSWKSIHLCGVEKFILRQKTLLSVLLWNLCVTVRFGIVRKLAITMLLGIYSIGNILKIIFSARWKIVLWLSHLVMFVSDIQSDFYNSSSLLSTNLKIARTNDTWSECCNM